MSEPKVVESPILRNVVDGLSRALGHRLKAVVLYGSAARGDYQKRTSDFNLALVLESLDPGTLEDMAPAVRAWTRRGQPPPRLLSTGIIAEASDVFPIELLDIRANHVVLHGADPFADMEVRRDHLRLQCERELREKLMRLREGYIEAHRSKTRLRRLLTDSYTTFVALFRGCLRLLGHEPPVHNAEVVAAFCTRAGLDPAPFDEVDKLKRGESVEGELKTVFSRYYHELTQAVLRVDRFEPGGGGETR